MDILQQMLLALHGAFARLQARVQLFGIARLHQEIVSPRLQPGDHVVLRHARGGEEDKVKRLVAELGAGAPAGFIATHLRHLPVEHREFGGLGILQNAPRFGPFGDDDLSAPML